MMRDQVVVNGMMWGSAAPLVAPIDYEEFVQTLLVALGQEKEDFRREVDYAHYSYAIKGAFEFRAPDLNNPLEVRWALLLPPRSPDTEAIATALDPLVQHRHGQVIYSPTPLTNAPESWIFDNYTYMDEEKRPYYVLLAGSPQDIPFRFQYLLDVNAAVGRLAFERVEDYAAYAQKVVEFETNDARAVARRAVVFATEHEGDGATLLSRRYMTDPLVAMIQEDNVTASYLAGDEATRANLEATLQGEAEAPAPALVYTASHGLGVPGEDEASRRQLQGALVCQDYDGQGGVFSADHVPAEPFLHGSVVFTFACYGAGTPQQSDFFHWIRKPSLLNCRPTADFLAALPTRLLGHQQGPLAFFGHLDPAWVYSFADPQRVATDKGWGSRMAPFRQAVSHLLQGATVGYAVKKFNEVYAQFSTELAHIEDQFRRDTTRGGNPQWTRRMVDIWMTRNDTQNFIILGDPAVKVKMRE